MFIMYYKNQMEMEYYLLGKSDFLLRIILTICTDIIHDRFRINIIYVDKSRD